MPEEQRERAGITAAVDSTDWSRYAGPASAVRRRGERRRRRRQATAALGTTFAAVGVAVTMNGLVAKAPATQQGAAPAPTTTSPSSTGPTGPTGPTGTASSNGANGPATSASYPTFPAKLPTKPIFIADPGHVLHSGVLGAGTVSGHQWQISYRVIPSGSAANSQPEVTQTDVSLDGKTVTAGGGEGAKLNGAGGFAALDGYFKNSGVTNPIVVVSGSPSPGVSSIDLRWMNGVVVQVPIWTVDGARFAPFAWDPRNPPEAVEQVSPSGVQKIAISHDSDASWSVGPAPKPITPASPPTVSTPTGTPNLSQTPQVKRIDSGFLGAGTVAGHTWQEAYEIIPSGSAANSSPEVYCTDATVDGKTQQGGCTSSKPFNARGMSFSYDHGHMPFPIVVDSGGADPGTTLVGLEWADGTKTATAVHMVEGVPVVALAFDPDNPPKYLLEFGSYGEYRLPLTERVDYSWTFNWPY